MKLIKMIGLAAMAALMAMAFAGASSAMAETTALCNTDPGTGSPQACAAGHLVTHVHETTLAGAKATLLSSAINVQLDVLFLGDATSALANPGPLVIEGNFTYTNANNGCTDTEVGGPAVIEVLKEGHETAKVTFEFEMHVNCSGFINCTYNGEGLTGTVKGPLLSSETNGSFSLSEQVLHKVSGIFCPATAKLDIVTTPLSATYITN